MMRNFDFDNNDANISAANIAGIRSDLDQPIETLRLDEPIYQDQASLSSFHKSTDNDDNDTSNNAAKIAGAVMVGLLLVGGSIYAYESMTGKPQTVAMLPAAPQRNAKVEQPVTAPVTSPDANSAPSVSTARVMSTSRPGRVRAVLAGTTPSPDSASQIAATSSTHDSSVNQPMTLTPENAPPPQQSAMQQPITAPTVTSSSADPTPEVANNFSGTPVQPDPTPSNVMAPPADTSISPAKPAAPLPNQAQ
jgi:hypothetical protein